MRVLFWLLVVTVVLLLSLSSALLAQSTTCETLIHQAFQTLGQTCGDAGGNSACFGHSASATFAAGETGTFAKPGDKLDLSSVQSILTLPLDTTAEQWGLALLNVPANVPLALSETGLKYILIGDTQVENAVAPENAFTPAPSITVTPVVAANLRASPSTDAQVLVSAPVGTELSADALSSDKGWVRVLNNGEAVWVSRQLVSAKSGKIDDLPVLGSDTRTLMQSFYLHTGADTPNCTSVLPSMLIIQGPSGLNATITVNGANIRFDSAIALRVTADNNLQVIVLGGGASIGGISIPAGFTLFVPLTPDNHDVAGLATGLRPITSDERNFLNIAAGDITQNNIVAAPLTVPTADQVAAVLVQLNSSAGSQTVAGPAAGKADCKRFKPTSPLGSLALGVTPFYWDGAPGATQYRLNIYGPDGSLRFTQDIESNSTTLQANTAGAIGDGSNFSWNVQALVNNQVACTTGTVSLPRDLTPQFVSGGGGGALPTPTVCYWDVGLGKLVC
jgi:SH3 domain-containing protein